LLKHKKWYKYKRDARMGDFVLQKDETAAGQTYKYARIIKVHGGTDGRVRSADIEYKIPGENKFRVSTRPIHKIVLAVPVEEQTMEEAERSGAIEENKLAHKARRPSQNARVPNRQNELAA
jgi:hypothetical protein